MRLITSLSTVKHFQKLLVMTVVDLILSKTCASKSEQVLKLHPSACVAVRKKNVLLPLQARPRDFGLTSGFTRADGEWCLVCKR